MDPFDGNPSVDRLVIGALRADLKRHYAVLEEIWVHKFAILWESANTPRQKVLIAEYCNLMLDELQFYITNVPLCPETNGAVEEAYSIRLMFNFLFRRQQERRFPNHLPHHIDRPEVVERFCQKADIKEFERQPDLELIRTELARLEQNDPAELYDYLHAISQWLLCPAMIANSRNVRGLKDLLCSEALETMRTDLRLENWQLLNVFIFVLHTTYGGPILYRRSADTHRLITRMGDMLVYDPPT